MKTILIQKWPYLEACRSELLFQEYPTEWDLLNRLFRRLAPIPYDLNGELKFHCKEGDFRIEYLRSIYFDLILKKTSLPFDLDHAQIVFNKWHEIQDTHKCASVEIADDVAHSRIHEYNNKQAKMQSVYQAPKKVDL